ncbi:replication protein A 32 kDa subunit isoform X1 [Bombus vancouverensis nearcticus]|uniref:Replication protein A 32 kDa subunit-like isoform X1 n=2 Tax=Bombus bifarius TaxID=103933 RepID=A0A6P8M968_9HYME|nr:replication protein A 32 kDa subunit-like isoform X1 [Bombus vancouverensis nearcticus]XP_033298072.1 replication protein A 32 kDa subunit-like isoform X1 [Bombus bifarius]
MWSNLDSTIVSASGGFLNDSQDQSDGNKKTGKRIKKIIPVMIQQLTQLNDNLEGSIITLVGIIHHIEKSSTKVTYEIEDETGHITCFQWLTVGKSESIINLNTYVRVFGYIREQTEIKHILILKIWPLTTLNELTNHLLEVTYVTLKIQKTSNNEDKSSDVPMLDDNLGLTKEQTIVYRVIQAENDSENGIERKTLKNRVPKNMLSTVDEIIDFLTSEGHIYTTFTDDHFKTT